jgi:O-antigen/teichoic acid export membrane protein
MNARMDPALGAHDRSRASAVSNVRWVALSQFGRVAIQLGSLVVFSRLLTPSDFGLFAMAAVVTNFAMLFRDMGTSAALIQRETLTRDLLNTVFTLNLASGFIAFALVSLASPMVAWGFAEPRLRYLLLAVSVGFPLASITAPHLALLERHSQFRKIASIELVSALFGTLFAFAAAICGAGVYSLILQSLLTTACSTVQLWRALDWRPKWSWSRDEFLHLRRFSGNLVAFNVINYFARNSDAMLIGRYLGPGSLGWYSTANRILMFPLQNVTFVLGRALLPIYSRQQSDRFVIGSTYLRTLALIATVTAPLMGGIWALRAPLIDVGLGPSWSAVTEILAWFAPMGFFQSLNSSTGTVLAARGRTDLLRTLGIVNTIILLGAFVFGLHFGLSGVVSAYFFATIVVTLISLRTVLREVGSGLSALGRRLIAPVACALAMALVVHAANLMMVSYFSDIDRLLVLIPMGALAYGAMLFALSPALVKDLYSTLCAKTRSAPGDGTSQRSTENGIVTAVEDDCQT